MMSTSDAAPPPIPLTSRPYSPRGSSRSRRRSRATTSLPVSDEDVEVLHNDSDVAGPSVPRKRRRVEHDQVAGGGGEVSGNGPAPYPSLNTSNHGVNESSGETSLQSSTWEEPARMHFDDDNTQLTLTAASTTAPNLDSSDEVAIISHKPCRDSVDSVEVLGELSVPSASNAASPREPLAAYTCPICFFPPTNATLTPCGHICCGPCLFTAVKATMQRSMLVAMDRAPAPRYAYPE